MAKFFEQMSMESLRDLLTLVLEQGRVDYLVAVDDDDDVIGTVDRAHVRGVVHGDDVLARADLLEDDDACVRISATFEHFVPVGNIVTVTPSSITYRV